MAGVQSYCPADAFVCPRSTRRIRNVHKGVYGQQWSVKMAAATTITVNKQNMKLLPCLPQTC